VEKVRGRVNAGQPPGQMGASGDGRHSPPAGQNDSFEPCRSYRPGALLEHLQKPVAPGAENADGRTPEKRTVLNGMMHYGFNSTRRC